MENKCVDCGTKISEWGTRCRTCCRSGSLNGMFGKSALKGKKYEDFRTFESINKTKKRLEIGLFKGRTHTSLSKSKIGKNVSGDKNGFYNKKHTKKTIDVIRQKTIEQHLMSRIKNTKTSIELIVENILKDLKINYVFQKPFGYWIYDFYLPDQNLFIECDGDYWHGNPKFYKKNKLNKTQQKNIANDKRKNDFLKNRNIKMMRFWETVIKNKPNIVKNEIRRRCYS